MECLQFRRRLEAEPNSDDPELLEHAAECPSCARFRKKAVEFDGLIRSALLVDLPVGAGTNTLPVASRRRGWLALAASVVLAVGIGAALQFTAPESEVNALAADVAVHLEHEPESFLPGLTPVDRARIEEMLAPHRMRIARDFSPIVYARICVVHGKQAAHLVVQSPAGAVTVMLLPDEPLREIAMLEVGTLSGRIIPTTGGGVAIVGHDQPVDAAAEQRIIAAVGWEA